MPLTRRLNALAMSAWLVAACGDTSSRIDEGPTFYRDMLPALQQHCGECHVPGGLGPMSLVAYDEAADFVEVMVQQVESQTMPPWGAFDTDECEHRHAFDSDLRLDDETIDLFAAWRDAGTPQGNANDAPEPAEPPDPTLPGATLDVTLPSWTVSGPADDQRCFVIDPGNSETSYLTGARLIPSRREVVHHTLLALDTDGSSADLVDPSGSFDCLTIVGEPIAVTDALPEGLGVVIPPGSRIVVQIHYHPIGATVEDATRVQLRLQPEPTTWELEVLLVGNEPLQYPDGDGLQPGPNDVDGVEFRIPAGATDHVETMRATIDPACTGICPAVDRRIAGVFNHMHYVGVDMKLSLERGESTECLLQTPRWDFDWQRWYMYGAEPANLPKIAPGDILTARCTYDNTLANLQLARSLQEPGLSEPIDVLLGTSSKDEMCIAFVAVAVSRN